jgi:hypothetical protein
VTGFVEGDEEFQLFDVHLRSGLIPMRWDSSVFGSLVRLEPNSVGLV